MEIKIRNKNTVMQINQRGRLKIVYICKISKFMQVDNVIHRLNRHKHSVIHNFKTNFTTVRIERFNNITYSLCGILNTLCANKRLVSFDIIVCKLTIMSPNLSRYSRNISDFCNLW